MTSNFSAATSSSPTIQLHSNPSPSPHPFRHSSLPPPPPPPPPPPHLHHQDRESFLERDRFFDRESFLGRERFLHRESFHESESFHEKDSFLSSKNMLQDNQRSFSYSNIHHQHHHPQHHQNHPHQYQQQHLHHYHHNYIPSGSPNYLKPVEINRSSCQGGASDLYLSSSSPYSTEDSRRRIPSRRCPEPSYSKFQVSEVSNSPYNILENAYAPRTPQVEDFAMATSGTLHRSATDAKFFPSAFKHPRNVDQQDIRMASMMKESNHCMPPQNQHRNVDQQDIRMASMMKESNPCMPPQNQIKLYRWYLIKCGTSSAEIAVGGLSGSGTAGNGRQETTAITKRMHKCRLLTKDGLEVCLTGLIDDCTTILNGFSIEIVQLFLSGFPYTWNHILQNEFQTHTSKDPVCLASGTGAFNRTESSELSSEGCADQEKCVPLSNRIETDTPIPDSQKDVTAYQEEHTESSLDKILQQSASDAIGEQDSQKYVTHITFSTHTTEELRETMQYSNKAVNESQEDMLPECQTSDNGENVLGVPKEVGKVQALDGLILSKERLAMKETVRKVKDDKEKSSQMSQLPKRVTRSMKRASRQTSVNENKIMNGATNCPWSDGGASENIERTDREVEDVNTSPATGTDMLLKEKTTSRRKSVGNNVDNRSQLSINIKSMPNEETKGKIQPSYGDERSLSAEVLDPNSLQESGAECQPCKEEKTELILRVERKIQSRSEERSLSCDLDLPSSLQEIQTDNELHKEKEGKIVPPVKANIPTIAGERMLRRSEVDTESPSHEDKDASCRLGITPPTKGSIQSTCGEKRSSISEVEFFISLEDEETRTESQSHEDKEVLASCRRIPVMKKKKRTAKEKSTSPEVGLMNVLKDEETGTESQSCEDKEMHASCREEMIPPTKGKVHARSRERRSSSSEIIDLPESLQEIEAESQVCEEKERLTPCRSGMIPPPLPCPRIPVSKQLISAAFGLKTSRSGRLLVPPLAHWCSQSLLRDKDGGIIAISNGSMNMGASETGFSKFTPPAEVNLQNLQKRLREAAEGRNKKTVNKKKKKS